MPLVGGHAQGRRGAQRADSGRYLLKPTKKVRSICLGALGRAQRLYGVEIHGFCFLSNHYHLLISVENAQQMADFVGYFQSKLAREIARLTGWREKIWGRRYTAIPVSHEEAAQTWYDRTAEYRARQQRKSLTPEDFAELETVELSPLPCWQTKAHRVDPQHHPGAHRRDRRRGACGQGALPQAPGRRPPHRPTAACEALAGAVVPLRLESGAPEGLPCYPLYARDPHLERLRGEPEFEDLLAELRASWERWNAEL